MDAHLALMKRLDALRAHHGFISTYVVAAAAKGMSNQILRGSRCGAKRTQGTQHHSSVRVGRP